jgi:D-glycero-D-manno-heptose 1,7-bisphosphate phosphatase
VSRRAVFLDRDGVLIEDADLLVDPALVRPLPGAAGALARLAAGGFALVVVTNQTVVSRGLATESEVDALNEEVARRLAAEGAPPLDAVYVCPHHPEATVAAYRVDCDCRKPRPGLLRRASADLDLDLAASTMVGDRTSDVVAGSLAGCTTVLVRSGRHEAPPIRTTLGLETPVEPDHVAADLAAAADWILAR